VSAIQSEAPPLDAWARGLEQLLAEPRRIGLVFQPVVDLARGVTAGYEALARFNAAPQAPSDRWLHAAAGVLRVERLVDARAREGRSPCD